MSKHSRPKKTLRQFGTIGFLFFLLKGLLWLLVPGILALFFGTE